METTIRQQFEDIGVVLDNEAIVGKCTDLCHRFGLEPLDLAVKWNAFFMARKDVADTPTLESLELFAQDLSKGMSQKTTPKRTTVHYDKSTIGSGLANALVSSFGLSGDVAKAIKTSAQKPERQTRKRMSFASPQAVKRSLGGLGSTQTTPGTPQTPSQQHASSLPAESPKGISYAARSNAGHVELTFNPEQRPTEPSQTGRQKVHISVFPTTLQKPYRFMFEKLHDRAEVLDVRIEEMAEIIIRKNKLHMRAIKKAEETEDEEQQQQQQVTPQEALQQLNSVDFPTQDPMLVVGRVCVDAAEGKLNSRSVVLEGCLANSQGKRVSLDLSATKMFSLFPGQIIAAEGVNPTGDAFAPNIIYEGMPAPRKRTKPQELLDLYFANDEPDGGAVNVMIAAGPFTTTQDLTYAPLDDLLAKVTETKPEVVILVGPFVHDQHPLIVRSDFEESYEDVLSFVMEKIVGTVSTLPGTHAIVIPSLHDVTHDFIFPQAPLQVPSLEHERVHFLANPSTFMINELTFGVTSNDVLFHLSRTEASNMHSDRMQRLVNHLFEQRSFYPLDPPNENVHLDYAHIDNVKLPVTPDVMILPSALKRFVRDVNGSLAINPGFLTRLSAGGTYAHLVIHSPRRNDIPEKGKPLLSGVVERSVCRIVRI